MKWKSCDWVTDWLTVFIREWGCVYCVYVFDVRELVDSCFKNKFFFEWKQIPKINFVLISSRQIANQLKNILEFQLCSNNEFPKSLDSCFSSRSFIIVQIVHGFKSEYLHAIKFLLHYFDNIVVCRGVVALVRMWQFSVVWHVRKNIIT